MGGFFVDVFSLRSESKSHAGGLVMKSPNLQTMSVDELWELYEQIGRSLSEKLTSEKRRVELRLGKLQGDSVSTSSTEEPRQPYPKVRAKYQNPADPSQTWAGRGTKPRWVTEMLDAGMSIDDLRIRETV
jgi:DNA-binding protein H-NS